MPIDWDRFEREVDQALDDAEDRTDERLAGRISSVTRLTDDEIMELFPEPADVEKLKELMVIVNGAQQRNERVAALAQNIERLGGTVFTLLERFA
jgi:nucleotide-binding universal stress UspA family protein